MEEWWLFGESSQGRERHAPRPPHHRTTAPPHHRITAPPHHRPRTTAPPHRTKPSHYHHHTTPGLCVESSMRSSCIRDVAAIFDGLATEA